MFVIFDRRHTTFLHLFEQVKACDLRLMSGMLHARQCLIVIESTSIS